MRRSWRGRKTIPREENRHTSCIFQRKQATFRVSSAFKVFADSTTSPDGMISISIEALTKRFGSQKALDQVSLRIEPGELFFLLGPSGCGKTTLLRTLAGFVTPDEGKVFFDRDEVTDLPPHKRRTGMMFQSYALWPHLSVARNVAFGLEEQGVPSGNVKSESARRSPPYAWNLTLSERSVSCPAGSSRGWLWPGLWSCDHVPCCWMSRSPISTRNCVSRCGRRFAGLQGVRSHCRLRHP